MKKVVSIFLSVVLCLNMSLSFASAAGTDAWYNRLAAYQVSKWEDLPSDFQALAEAYVNTFNSIGTKGYFESVADIPLNWYYILDDTTPVLSVGGAVFYYLDGSGNLKYTKKSSSGSGNSIEDNATIVGSRDDLVVDGKRFKKYINDRSTYYEPTGSGYKISWANDKYFKNKSTVKELATIMTLAEKGNLFGIPGKRQLYVMPYFEESGNVYYYSCCLYFEIKFGEPGSANGLNVTEFDVKGVNLFDTTANLKDSDVYLSLFDEPTFSASFNKYFNGSYAAMVWYYGAMDFRVFFKDFNYFSGYTPTSLASGSLWDNHFSFPVSRFYRSDNLTLSITNPFSSSDFFPGGVRTERERQDVDWGFIVSDTPILMDGMGADIDTTKIPDNYYITVNGDTIYDYSITNPETGQSSTVNEYITNNYTYITNNNPGGDGGGSGSSGTTGGSVSVGGNVGVNGNVNVGGEVKFGGEVNVGVDVSPIDINVNVSGNSGGAGERVPDLELPDTSVFDGYLNSALDETTGIRKFIGDFFGSLPGEITTLVCIGLVLAILCRLLGR